jgi:LacI family transcriptional regulator
MMEKLPDNVTMKRLAQQLGVSRTTVSLVLKGQERKYRIREETAQRIREAVAQQGFRPNYFATALTSRRSGVIGVVFPNVFEAFMSEVVKGIEDVTHPADYTAMIATSRFDPLLEARVLDQLLHRGVDGLIIACNAPFRGEPYDCSHLHRLLSGPVPVVLVDRTLRDHPHASVVQDDRGGARKATAALLRAGSRRPCYVSLDIDVSSIRDRRDGFLDALREANIRQPRSRDILLTRRDPDADDLSLALEKRMSHRDPPDSFFVTTAGIAMKTRYLLSRMGLQVPKNIPMARFGADPPYSPSGMLCVEQPHVDMGRRAAQLLMETITGAARPDTHIVCPVRLAPAHLSRSKGA